MYTTIATLLPLLALAVAAPTANGPCRARKQTYVAKYDGLPFQEPGPNPIPPHYYGLGYTTFQIDQHDHFIPPTSGNQWAMAFGGSGNISVPDSPPKQTFQLESLSFACVSGVPQPECAISIWGWKASAKVINRVINFPSLDPGHLVGGYIMNKTSFSWEWRDLKSVGFSIARADNGGDMYGGLALDDVKYTLNFGC
ncbi:hypothetical protein BU26DRAFT_521633 [Trematosphaeria pertusa]|uniref:Uncharacterized protein n=1 Tax=Trematosphaeria pertusa TaxID=390896 RepID=A0A6A6I9G2_9PLEO|nr:uncharacterized protein BU26DRAFT_521633 [Trematosphaeria pertusa]KAF2246160.1 hypothetical protein BU26DRAFT_521633 [Trematosphaeria pertusa]